ncbi:MAG: 4Fe-4S binding protein [Candidatus Omnitrophica bacterium]|nr:4Fe-4S binding protein [Candidatus Omnitrophota bacterium]
MASRKKHTSWIVWLRRAIQTFFLLLFFYLFLETVYHPFNQVGGPVEFFFQIDPLVMIGTFLTTYAIPAMLLLSLITLAATIVFGRWFCGWICPFGALHNLFTSMRGRKGKMKALMEQGTYTNGQKTKYYILITCLAAAVFGVNAVGWMDPFSFFYRAMATSIYPAVNWGLEYFFTWVYLNDPHFGPLHAASFTEPIYDRLRDGFLSNQQPVYAGGTLIGLLFIFIVGLNFYKGRFWCRYLCPLGALLGVAGKNPMLRLNKRLEDCHNCRMCLVDCQGGAEPQTDNEWRPSECFYCWNCYDACSTQAITFSFQSSLTKGGVSAPSLEDAAAPSESEESAPAESRAEDETEPKSSAKSPAPSSKPKSKSSLPQPPKSRSKSTSRRKRKK